MITKELVDFIKKMRLENHTDTEIQSLLVNNGWLSTDAMEAFQSIDLVSKNVQNPPVPFTPPIAPMVEPVAPVIPISQISSVRSSVPVEPMPFQMPPNILSQINNLQPINVGIPKDISIMPKEKEKSGSHKGLIAFFIVLFFVLAFVIYGYFYRDSLKNLPLIKNFFPVVEVPQAVAVVPVPIVSDPIAPVITNCDNNMDCLIAAASKCQAASAVLSLTVTLPTSFLDQSINTKYEIKSSPLPNDCTLTFSNVFNSFSISDANRKMLNGKGMTDSQIDLQIKSMNESSAKAPHPPSTVCLATSGAVFSYLTDLKNFPGGTDKEVKISTQGNAVTLTYTTTTGLKIACTQIL